MEKKGVSVMVGYILLIVLVVTTGTIVFAALRTYVPRQGLDCPRGVEVFIKEATFDTSSSLFTLDLRNSGNFDIAGYFIFASNNSSQEIATLDISTYLVENASMNIGNSVIFATGINQLSPGESKKDVFEIPPAIDGLQSISIIPIRYQEEEGRNRFVSCSRAQVKRTIDTQV